MTQSDPEKTFFKRPLILALLAILLLAAAWVSYYLSTFDLNNYRQEAEDQLASMLSLPVKIEQLHYNFYEAHVALIAEGVRIGSEESFIQVEAPRTIVSLKWQGLFARKIQFAEISLDKPEIWVRQEHKVTAADGNQEPEVSSAITSSLLSSVGINELEILDGTVNIESGAFDSAPVIISDIDGELSNIKLGNTSDVTIRGDLKIPGQAGHATWHLQGETTLALDDNNRPDPHFDLDLDIKGLDLSTLNQPLAVYSATAAIKGQADIQLSAKGTPSDNDFQIGGSSDQITFRPNENYLEPATVQNFFAQGHLLTGGDTPGIKGLSLQVDKSRLAGDINWTPPGEPFQTDITIFSSDLKISQIKQWLPELQGPAQTFRQKVADNGNIKLEHAEFSFRQATGSLERQWIFSSLKGEILEFVLDSGTAQAFKLKTLPFSFSEDSWQIGLGNLQWGAQQFTLSGAGDINEEGLYVSAFDINGTILPTELMAELQVTDIPVAIDGPVTIKSHLEGPLKKLTFDLHGDLSQLSLNHPEGLELTPKPDDSLNLHGSFNPDRISLDHGAIRWGLAKGHISGEYLPSSPDSLSLEALLTIEDLTKLAETIPVLTKTQLHGQADLAISQHGSPAQNPPEMVLTLRDAGLRPTKYIADLNRINGRVVVTTKGLFADRLQVYMGDSPLTVKAQLVDFAAPILNLDVQATSVRARDIIFHSDTAMLRDINGQLKIDRNGLLFDKVDVRLDGGTDASVSGTISFKAPYEVQLDITSEFAQISEVVALWSGEKNSKESDITEDASTQKPQTKTFVTINANAVSGDLYGMKFQKASGVITPGRHRLIIHPLVFSANEGYCDAQVIVDFSKKAPPQLRISGHAEDVDALEVYRELLNQKNIIRGKLRGDFYVTGEIGANYLPSSYGEFSVEVNKGVLHEFQVLSKVFSLLNVSQIFAFKLPDMDLEGMPFDKLSANFHLDHGVLKSDDLKIMSEAMNQAYAGQLDLVNKEIDLTLQVHPLGTVDKIISRIPVAGWLLTGDNKAFLTAYFSVTGKIGDVSVEAMPLNTLSDQTIGLLKRTFGLPFKLAEDPQILWGGDGSKKKPNKSSSK